MVVVFRYWPSQIKGGGRLFVTVGNKGEVLKICPITSFTSVRLLNFPFFMILCLGRLLICLIFHSTKKILSEMEVAPRYLLYTSWITDTSKYVIIFFLQKSYLSNGPWVLFSKKFWKLFPVSPFLVGWPHSPLDFRNSPNFCKLRHNWQLQKVQSHKLATSKVW